MKFVFAVLIALMLTLQGYAQDLTLTFNSTGASGVVDSIIALNQTTNQKVSVEANVLQLKATVSSNIELTADNTAKAWPNPFTETVNIVFPLYKDGKVQITVVNIQGQTVINEMQNLDAGINKYAFTAKGKGLYLIQIITPDNTYRLSVLSNASKMSQAGLKYVGKGEFAQSRKVQNLKSIQVNPSLSYTPGDRILFKIKGGIYSTVISDIPRKDSIYSVPFMACTDADNNNYSTVKIGTQTWMAENLKTTKYNDNTSIPMVTDSAAWVALTTPAYCWYDNDEASYKNIYGGLYNWYVVDGSSNGGKNACPIGWHVPTDDEWTTMENYLIANGYNYDGTTDNDGDRSTNNKIAKSLAATTNWLSFPFTGSVGYTDYPEKRNITGFSALPGGGRIHNGTFGSMRFYGVCWSSTANGTTNAWRRYVSYGSTGVVRYGDYKVDGFSVRCVRD